MMTTGEGTIVAHVHSDLGENAGCGIASNPRYRTGQFHLLLIRCEFLLNLLVEFFDHLFNKLHVFQSLPDEWVMDRGIPTEEILSEMRDPARQVSYLVETPKSKIKQYEQKWLDLPWKKVRDSVDVRS